MKTHYKNCLVLCVATAFLLMAVSAFAFPISYNEYNGVFFNNSEVYYDNDQSGSITIGDQFAGVIQLNGIKASGLDDTGQTGANIWPVVPGPTFVQPYEITGYFLQQVVGVFNVQNVDVDPIGDPGGVQTQIGDIVFGPGTSDPNNISALNYGAGEVLQVFESNTVDFNDSSQVLAFSSATNGTPTFSLGFAYDNIGAVPTTDNYWYTPGAPLDPTVPFVGTNDVGITYAGLDYITQPGWAYRDVNDPNEGVFDTMVDFWLNSEIFTLNNWGTADHDTLMHFGSNDPGVHYPVPEPSTFLLLGAGLIGLVTIYRRKSRS